MEINWSIWRSVVRFRFANSLWTILSEFKNNKSDNYFYTILIERKTIYLFYIFIVSGMHWFKKTLKMFNYFLSFQSLNEVLFHFIKIYNYYRTYLSRAPTSPPK
jgi:hypothetical protein